ncbi:P-loop NTPase family protein [Marinobacter halotolerans]|uniref:DUF1611 domain-containing protein n=1 Tax=Marinobacter halotolerans TaxID=1569211 RepID=UPI0012476EB6|nr:DUF1611 domain-containing protein [Marinobacter halotolerans]
MSFNELVNDPTTQLTEAKWSFATRRVNQADAVSLETDFADTQHGDLILGRVMSLGKHGGIQLSSGRRSELFTGDLVVLPCAARYAPDQFEGTAEIDPEGADMLASGGCLGKARAKNERVKPPTRVLPIGRLTNVGGAPVNLTDYALPKPARKSRIPVIAVFGTAMNSGKTLATARLGYGLRQTGLRVATIKATGTGSFGDFNEFADTGVHYIADFTDAGLATTYLLPLNEIKDGIERLLFDAEQNECDVVVMEVADGLFQRESAALLADTEFRERIGGMVFACGDAVAAAGGVQELRRLGYEPEALTGMLSCSPMATAEAQAATGIRVMTKGELSDPGEAMAILRRTTQPQTEAETQTP